MTTCKIIVTAPPTRKPKPIQFIKFSAGVVGNNNWTPIDCNPTDWKNIELISGINRRNNTYKICYDIMFAYDNDRSMGVVILGYWNDGVVE